MGLWIGLDWVGLGWIGLDWVDAIIIWLCKKNNNITYIYNKQFAIIVINKGNP